MGAHEISYPCGSRHIGTYDSIRPAMKDCKIKDLGFCRVWNQYTWTICPSFADLDFSTPRIFRQSPTTPENCSSNRWIFHRWSSLRTRPWCLPSNDLANYRESACEKRTSLWQQRLYVARCACFPESEIGVTLEQTTGLGSRALDIGMYKFRLKYRTAPENNTRKMAYAALSKSVILASIVRNSTRQPVCGSWGGLSRRACQTDDAKFYANDQYRWLRPAKYKHQNDSCQSFLRFQNRHYTQSRVLE